MAVALPASSLPDQCDRAPTEFQFVRAAGSIGDGAEGAELVNAGVESFVVDWQLPARFGGLS
jgi:hypothetical protein